MTASLNFKELDVLNSIQLPKVNAETLEEERRESPIIKKKKKRIRLRSEKTSTTQQ